MILEMRTLQLKIAGGARVAAAVASGLPARTALSPLGGYFETEVGTLNQVIQLWPYGDTVERDHVADQVAQLDGWPPPIFEDVLDESVRLLEPLPFSPPLQAGQFGAIYEFRTYTYGPGFMPEVIERWSEKIEARRDLSPFIGAYRTLTGRRDQLLHVWAYANATQRQEIRAHAIAVGAWPPNTHAEGMLLRQENVLAIPAPFSPLR